MIMYAILDSTQVVIGTGEAATIEDALASSEEFGTVIALEDGEEAAENRHYLSGDEFLPLPERPGAWAVWNGSQWTDPRTQAEIDAAEAAHLLARRAATDLTKLEFVLRAVTAGLISQASGLVVLDGQMPPELAGMIASLTEAQVFEMTARLKGAQVFNRLDPFILQCAAYLGVTDAEMDALFSVTV